MTQNLDFNIDSTKTYTSVDTDLTQYNVGSYTSTKGYSYSFYFGKSSFAPTMNDFGKDDGMSIRCIVR